MFDISGDRRFKIFQLLTINNPRSIIRTFVWKHMSLLHYPGSATNAVDFSQAKRMTALLQALVPRCGTAAISSGVE